MQAKSSPTITEVLSSEEMNLPNSQLVERVEHVLQGRIERVRLWGSAISPVR